MSRYLLIVNSYTENNAITQMKAFVHKELHLGVDIFNISLSGTFKDKATQKSILPAYRGKSIIIAGNQFNYFGRYFRYNWDLIDPREGLFLSMNKTSFLFCGVRSTDAHASLNKFQSLLKYPDVTPFVTDGALQEHKGRGALLKSFCNATPSAVFSLDARAQYTLSGSLQLFKSRLTKRLDSHGKAIQGKLEKALPMRRFVIAAANIPGELVGADTIHPKKPKKVKTPKRLPSTGVITVVEGLSRSTSSMISFAPLLFDERRISRHQVIMMVASIPFQDLATIFWNIVQAVEATGIDAEDFYRSLPAYSATLDRTDEENTEDEKQPVLGSKKLISIEVCIILRDLQVPPDVCFCD
jgi:hypothetical protein